MKLFLLDGHALVYRAHYSFAKRPLINSKNLNVSAIQGFVTTLWELLQKEKPTHIAVAFDMSGGTFRNEIFADYKANRMEQPEDITVAIPYIKKILHGFHIPVLEMPGFEADDIIGTVAKKAEKEGFEVYMMTPDKDYGQLVTDKIFLYRPASFGNGIDIMGVKEVCEKWDISNISQVIDMLGLQGDKVDNIPGVPGIGPKKAGDLLKAYGSIEEIYEHINEIPEKVRVLLQDHKEQALMSKKLAVIDIEVPIDFDATRFALDPMDKPVLTELFKELEFRTLSAKILGSSAGNSASDSDAPKQDSTPKKAKATDPGQQSLFGDEEMAAAPQSIIASQNISNTEHKYDLVDTPEKRKELIATLAKTQVFCFDTETTGIDANSAELVGMSFSIKAHEGWYVPVPANQDEAKALVHEFKDLLENEAIAKIGQNIKYDVNILHWYGVEVKGKFADTMIAHYLLEPDKRHNMDYLSETFLNYAPVSIETLIGKKGKQQLSMRQVPVEKVAEYAAEDADITYQLEGVLFEKMPESVRKLYDDIEEPLIKVLADIERTGINLDSDFLKQYSATLDKDILQLQDSIYTQAGSTTINLNSPAQIGELLFVKMKIPYRWRKTKTGAYSTDEEILSELATEYEFVKDILDLRELNKLKSTYVDALPKLVNPRTGRIHSSFNQALAQTGRLSSQNPNLQNIPVRTERGREVRKAFVPRNADHRILSADYSQIELRLIAEIAAEEAMLEAFLKGEDIHASTAAKVFGVPIEEVSKEQRYKAKTINFSIIYGAGALNLSRQLGIKMAEGKELIAAYFAQYKGLKSYMERIVQTARNQGYVETLCGRRRYLRDINSRNDLARTNEERIAINTPIQGSAADMIKVAMINIHDKLKKEQFETKMVLQVHDELVFDAPIIEIPKVKELIIDSMRFALPNLKVPIEVGWGEGANWLEAH